MQQEPGTITIQQILDRRKAQKSIMNMAPPAVRGADDVYPLPMFIYGSGGEPPYPDILNGRRWTIYKQNTACVYCGLPGTHAVVWQDYNWIQDQVHDHYDMIHISEHGHRVLMTLDHFIPRSKGGSNGPENLVVACSPCNNIKQDKFLVDFDPRPKPTEVPQ